MNRAVVAIALGLLVGACSGSGSEEIQSKAPDVDDSTRGPDATLDLADAVFSLNRADLTVTYESARGTEVIALNGRLRSISADDFFFLEDGRARTLCTADGCTESNDLGLDVPSGSTAELIDLLQLPLPCHDPAERGNCDLRLDDPRTIAGRSAFCVEGFLDDRIDRREQRCYDEQEGVLLFLATPDQRIEATAARPSEPADFEITQDFRAT